MKHSFLVAPPCRLNQPLDGESGAGGGALSEITRRKFLKRTGGATVATLVAFNITSAVAAATTTSPYFSGPCSWTLCTVEPLAWWNSVTSPAPPPPAGILAEYYIELVWDVTGPWIHTMRGIPLPLGPMKLTATATLKKVAAITGTVTIERTVTATVSQTVVCDTSCAFAFSPPLASDTKMDGTGHLALVIKLDHGVVTSVWAHDSDKKITTSPTITNMAWAYECV